MVVDSLAPVRGLHPVNVHREDRTGSSGPTEPWSDRVQHSNRTREVSWFAAPARAWAGRTGGARKLRRDGCRTARYGRPPSPRVPLQEQVEERIDRGARNSAGHAQPSIGRHDVNEVAVEVRECAVVAWPVSNPAPRGLGAEVDHATERLGPPVAARGDREHRLAAGTDVDRDGEVSSLPRYVYVNDVARRRSYSAPRHDLLRGGCGPEVPPVPILPLGGGLTRLSETCPVQALHGRLGLANLG